MRPTIRRLLSVIVALSMLPAVQAAPLAIGVRGHQVNLPAFSLFASPGESLTIELLQHDVGKIQLYLDGKAYGQPGQKVWNLAAPETPGIYDLQITQLETHARTGLKLFVGTPAAEVVNEQLNNYRIGPSPPGNEKYPLRYRAPAVFFEVTPDNLNTPLSPHFTLGQFLCKQESGFPKYIVIQESLLVLLEGLVSAVKTAGYPVETFGVISGYRTPYYNKRIGNVPNSRHVYGDAMDFFVDLDSDGRLDDLNGDGLHNRADVDILQGIVDQFKRDPANALLVGGVGRYYQASHHGGFIHVDTRGYRARW